MMHIRKPPFLWTLCIRAGNMRLYLSGYRYLSRPVVPRPVGPRQPNKGASHGLSWAAKVSQTRMQLVHVSYAELPYAGISYAECP